MLLVCPTCEASYQIDDGKIGPAGRTVRCKKCATVWFASLPPPDLRGAISADAPDGADAAPSAPAATVPVFDDSPGAGAPAVPDGGDAMAESGWSDGGDPDAARAPMMAMPVTDDHAVAGEPAPAIEHVQASSARSAVKSKKARPRAHAGLPAGRRLRQAAPYVLFAACLAAISVVALREPVARAVPFTARIFAALGLPVAASPVRIMQVRSEVTRLDQVEVLIVEGELTNGGSRTVPVPAIRIAVRDAAGTEVYHWTADVMKPVLEGGERSQFRARLASPPANGRSVAVQFGEARTDSRNQPAPGKS